MAKRTVIGRAQVSEKISFWQNTRKKFRSFYSSRKVRSLIPWSIRKPVISKALFQAPVQHLPLAMASPNSFSLVVLFSSTLGIFSLFWSKTCGRGNLMIFFTKYFWTGRMSKLSETSSDHSLFRSIKKWLQWVSVTWQPSAWNSARHWRANTFKFSLTLASGFSFSFDSKELALDKKKPSPSTIVRNARRKEEFL